MASNCYCCNGHVLLYILHCTSILGVLQVNNHYLIYDQAIKHLEDCSLQNETEENQMNQVLLKLYSNMAQCALELGQSARAIKYARKVSDESAFSSAYCFFTLHVMIIMC